MSVEKHAIANMSVFVIRKVGGVHVRDVRERTQDTLKVRVRSFRMKYGMFVFVKSVRVK